MSKFTNSGQLVATAMYKGNAILTYTRESTSIKDQKLYRAEVVTSTNRIEGDWTANPKEAEFAAEELINSWN